VPVCGGLRLTGCDINRCEGMCCYDGEYLGRKTAIRPGHCLARERRLETWGDAEADETGQLMHQPCKEPGLYRNNQCDHEANGQTHNRASSDSAPKALFVSPFVIHASKKLRIFCDYFRSNV